jgi:hypothetical protein
MRNIGYGANMLTKLEKMALKQIKKLRDEAGSVLIKNYENMGEYSSRTSGCGLLTEKLYEIDSWLDALIEGA